MGENKGGLGHKLRPFVYLDGVRRPDCPDTLLTELLTTRGYSVSVVSFMTDPLKTVAATPALARSLPSEAFTSGAAMLWNPAPKGSGGTIYSALVMRLQMLAYLATTTAGPASEAHLTHQCLAQWQDAHMALVCYVEANGVFDDVGLGDKSVEAHMPKVTLIFHEGELPDIIRSVMYCSFWGDNDHKFVIGIVHLLSKAIPHRCGIRGLAGIIRDKIKSEPAILHALTMMLAASMLGVYATAKVTPDFHVRKALYKFFFFGDEEARRAFLISWLEAWETSPDDPNKTVHVHEHTIFYVLKEFLCMAVALVPSLYQVLCQRYPWAQFERSVASAMDRMRGMIIGNARVPGKDFFTGVEDFLTSYDVDNERYLYKPRRMTFVDAMIKATEDLETDELHERLNPDLIPEAHRTALTTLVEQYSPYQPIIPTTHDFEDPADAGPIIDAAVKAGLFPLACFGVSKAAIEALIKAQQRFEEDGSDRAVRVVLKKGILGDSKGRPTRQGEHDYQVIRNFYVAVHAHMWVRTFTLPEHYFVAQEQALRAKHAIPNGVPSPPEMGRVLYCKCCRVFHGFLVKGRKTTKRSTGAVQAYGSDKVIVDDETLKLYCGFRRGDRNDTKKRSSTKGAARALPGVKKDPLKEKRKTAKDTKKARMFARCIETELQQFNITGKVLQLGKQIIVLCTHCGNPTPFEQRKYSGDRFTCGQCDKQRNVHNHIACVYCNKDLDPTDLGPPIRVLNDMDQEGEGELSFRDIHLCPKHCRAWIKGCTTTLKLSEIFAGLEGNWRVYRELAGTIGGASASKGSAMRPDDSGVVPMSQAGGYRRGKKHQVPSREKQ